eukprot:5446453-Pleurochrysis_carterae.AAC.1
MERARERLQLRTERANKVTLQNHYGAPQASVNSISKAIRNRIIQMGDTPVLTNEEIASYISSVIGDVNAPLVPFEKIE